MGWAKAQYMDYLGWLEHEHNRADMAVNSVARLKERLRAAAGNADRVSPGAASSGRALAPRNPDPAQHADRGQNLRVARHGN